LKPVRVVGRSSSIKDSSFLGMSSVDSPSTMPCHEFGRHHHHCFFNDSALFRPFGDVRISCLAYHFIATMSPQDVDLAWALHKCFACGSGDHRVERCRAVVLPRKHVCEMMAPGSLFGKQPLSCDSRSPLTLPLQELAIMRFHLITLPPI